MKKEKFILYFSTLISGILITMFISAFLTYLGLSQKNLFFEKWPLNWFYASIIAFPIIMIVRPISLKITQKLANMIFSN